MWSPLPEIERSMNAPGAASTIRRAHCWSCPLLKQLSRSMHANPPPSMKPCGFFLTSRNCVHVSGLVDDAGLPLVCMGRLPSAATQRRALVISFG